MIDRCAAGTSARISGRISLDEPDRGVLVRRMAKAGDEDDLLSGRRGPRRGETDRSNTGTTEPIFASGCSAEAIWASSSDR